MNLSFSNFPGLCNYQGSAQFYCHRLALLDQKPPIPRSRNRIPCKPGWNRRAFFGLWPRVQGQIVSISKKISSSWLYFLEDMDSLPIAECLISVYCHETILISIYPINKKPPVSGALKFN